MVELEHIGYSSLQDIAYERIRDALRKGAFQPGEGLRTRTLAKALGVSTTPVREALARLVAQKVLAVDPVNGTPYVPVITREQLLEIFELREVLEQLAAQHAAENITDEEMRHLDTLRARMKKAKSQEKGEYVSASEEFQLTVYRAARRPALFDLIQHVWLRSYVVLNMLSKPRPKDFTVDGHRNKLFAALKKGDVTAAGEANRDAVRATRDMLLGVMGK